jgi:mannose-6-phosphate isomerase-like protein (cupin superfamily)
VTIATHAEAPRFESGAFEFFPLAVPSRGSKELAVWCVNAGPGAASPPHQHDREVIFVVRSGRLTATIGELEAEAGPGDALIVPPATDFALRNLITEPASATVATTAGMQAIIGSDKFPPPWSI